MDSSSFDFRTEIAAGIRKVGQTYASDLQHISDEQLRTSPMGAARAPITFTAECIGFNLLCAKLISGEQAERMSGEEREQFYASVDSGEKARRMLAMSTENLASTLEKLSDDQVFATVQAPWGDTMKAYALAQMAAMHMMYHDGQVNYVQALYGDDVNHWAG